MDFLSDQALIPAFYAARLDQKRHPHLERTPAVMGNPWKRMPYFRACSSAPNQFQSLCRSFETDFPAISIAYRRAESDPSARKIFFGAFFAPKIDDTQNRSGRSRLTFSFG